MQKHLKFYGKCTIAVLLAYFVLVFDDLVAVAD